MRSDIVPGGVFPDFELPDHTGKRRKVSELQGNDPLILTLARGHYCPKEHQQHLELAAFYPKIALAYTQIVTIITRTRCLNTRSQASEPAVDATYRINALVSQAKSGSLSDESLVGGDLRITEFILTYDGKPSYTVDIMEFMDDKVTRETPYFAGSTRGSRIARSMGRADGHIISLCWTSRR